MQPYDLVAYVICRSVAPWNCAPSLQPFCTAHVTRPTLSIAAI